MIAADPVDLKFVDEAIQRIGTGPDAVLPILQAMQEFYGYLPQEALVHISQHSRIRPAAIAGVASFYDMFRRKPAGKHIVRVCRGTACHVTGAERVEDALRRQLGIGAAEDSDPERTFTIEPVACLGCCTLAPVVKISSGYVRTRNFGENPFYPARVPWSDKKPSRQFTFDGGRAGSTRELPGNHQYRAWLLLHG